MSGELSVDIFPVDTVNFPLVGFVAEKKCIGQTLDDQKTFYHRLQN